MEMPHTSAPGTAPANSQHQLPATWMQHLGHLAQLSLQITAVQPHLTTTAQEQNLLR